MPSAPNRQRNLVGVAYVPWWYRYRMLPTLTVNPSVTAPRLARPHRYGRVACAVGASVYLALLGNRATADAAMELAARLDPALPKAHATILLDASGSMTGKYSVVRQAGLAFARGLSARESLTARAFASNITPPIEASGPEAANAIDAGLPRQPMAGAGTDLGLALFKALEDMDRPDAAPIQTWFVITDGLHQPPPDSDYSRDFAGDPAWRGLRKRAHALAGRTKLMVYGLGLGAETDISVLRSVFPVRNVELLAGDAQTAGTVMAQVQRRMRLERLKSLLAQDLGANGITVKPKNAQPVPNARTISVPCDLYNGYSGLSVSLSDVRLHSSAAHGNPITTNIELTTPITLKPGQHASATITYRLRRTKNRWRLGRVVERIDGSWRLSARPVFNEANVLDDLGLSGTPRLQITPATARFVIAEGKPWRLIGAFGLSVILAILGWFHRTRRLSYSGISGQIGAGAQCIDLAGIGKDRVSVGPPSADIPLDGVLEGADSVTLFMERNGDNEQIALAPAGYHITVNGEPVGAERLLEQGDTVRIGAAQFSVLDPGSRLVCDRRMWKFVVPCLAMLAFGAIIVIA